MNQSTRYDSRKSMKWTVLAALSAIALFLPGCGKSNLPCIKAKCELYVDGKLVGPAAATFYRNGAGPEDRKTVASIGSDGTGDLSTFKANDGIPEGEYKVTVFPAGISRSPIAKTYNDPAKSPLKATVFSNTTVIKLELEGIKTPAGSMSALEKLGAKSSEQLVEEAMSNSNN